MATKPLLQETLAQRSLIFARLAQIAYDEPAEAKKQARKLGFTTVEFYDRSGAQAYRFQNKNDLVIACRGTQPTEFNDIKADLRALPIMAETIGRVHERNIQNPYELYTYGSPRVGWRKYVKTLGVKHIRWQNNNDIVTRVPLWCMGYVHHGEKHYMNAYGQVRNPSGWQLVKDRWRGMWMGLKQGKIDNFGDHSMVQYVANLENYNENK